MMSHRRVVNFFPTHLATYPGSFPFPKGWYLPCSSPLVRLRTLFPPDEPRSAYHRLGITQIRLQAKPLKHYYHGRKCCMYADRVFPCYSPIICIKSDVVLSYRPSEPMLILMGSTDLLKGRPDHCIHYDIKKSEIPGLPVSLLSPC